MASLNELLALNVSALGLLQDALLVGDAEQADKMQIQGLLSALSGPLNKTNLKVGDLLVSTHHKVSMRNLLVDPDCVEPLKVLSFQRGKPRRHGDHVIGLHNLA